MTRRAKRLGGLATLAALAAGAVAVAWWRRSGSATPVSLSVPVATATVVRTDLASSTQLTATLGFAGAYTVTAQGPAGTVTAVAPAGQTLNRGDTVYELDGQPVTLFYGDRPAWRPFALGMSPGPDIRQLEANLTAVGAAQPANLTVDDVFTAATAGAIRRWQYTTGRPVTGAIGLGVLTFQPGPLRVAAVATTVGALVPPGTAILTATSPTPVVNLAVPAGQAFLVHPGDAVTVTLPAGNSTPGRVVSISAVASAAATTNGPAGPQGGPPQPTVPAVVALSQPSAADDLDQAPVTVSVTDQVVHDVLAVPITALVALAGGGYGLYVDGGPAGRRLLPVTPGLFATTLVQVTASGLQAGDSVEVPAP